MSENRPTFYFEGNPVRASGILLYTYVNNQMYFLFRKSKYFEDLGGKTDFKDENISNTAVREFLEETNSEIISRKEIETLIENSVKLYFKNSKYVLHLIECDNSIKWRTGNSFLLKDTDDNKEYRFFLVQEIPFKFT